MRVDIQGGLLASASALTLMASVANAQTTPTAAAPAPADQGATAPDPDAPAVGEIVVTAQRRTENVQKVPLAIQAVRGDTLALAGVQEIRQLATLTPTFSFSTGSSTPTITLRGIGTQIGQIAGESSVALQLDGAPLLRLQYLTGSFFDVERLEVLRGPQGTIAGRNATGGVLNVISRRPTFNMQGGAEFTYGNYNTTDESLWASGPVIDDKLAAHFAVEKKNRDGFINSTRSSDRYGGADDISARVALLGRPVEGFEVLLAADYYNSNDVSPPNISLGLYDPTLGAPLPAISLGGPALPNAAEPGGAPFGTSSYYDPETHTASYSSFAGGKDSWLQKTYGFNLQTTINISPVTTLKTITDYHNLDGGEQYGAERAPVPLIDITEHYKQHQFAQEAVLTSSVGKTLDLLLGGQYLDETASEQTTSLIYAGLTPAFAPAFASVQYQDTIKLRSLAVFGQAQWRFAPTLQLTLGGRYTSDRKTASGTFQLPIGGPVAASSVRPAVTFNSFTPRVALDWKPNSDITAYVSVSKGFKGGGFGSGIALGAAVFRPETVWNYEAGLKTSFFDHRVTANVTAFWADYKNLQYAFYVSQQTIVKNAGAARSRGIEVETAFHPSPAAEFGLNATYLDAKYTDFCAADPGRPTTPVVTCPNGDQGLILNGNRLSQAPEFSGSAYASYRFDLGGKQSLTLRGDIRYQSRVYFTAFNYRVDQNGYAVANARATYDAGNGLSLSGFVTNLFDKTYYTDKLPQGVNLAGPGFIPLSVLTGDAGFPRMFGATVAYKFH